MKLIIVFLILIVIVSFALADLSDEGKKIVDDLRWKHYPVFIYDGTIEWNRDFLRMWVEDGIFYVETQDGKWFIEMEKVEKE